MSHRKLGSVKKKIRQYDVAELRALLIFIQTLLGATGKRTHRKGSRRSSKHSKKRSRHLRPGVHMVRVGHSMRKVKVLSSGKWQFMKG